MNSKKDSLTAFSRIDEFKHFWSRINNEMLRHPVITDNRYTKWYANGEMSLEQLRAFVVQFSVFSNLFLIAQLKKMLNADSIENMRLSREILANEIGVANHMKENGEPTVEGGHFRHGLAHFEWLLILSKEMGLAFNDLGKRHHGSRATLTFCDALERLYGHEDYSTALAASFAVENWANAGFWKELILGLHSYNEKNGTALKDNFFVFHDKLEEHHAKHTQDELREIYFLHPIDEDKFIRVGNEMLDAIGCFWSGLDRERKRIARKTPRTRAKEVLRLMDSLNK